MAWVFPDLCGRTSCPDWLRICVCVCVWVCVLDTWSLNRVFRMSVSVYFSVQGSLQRSFSSLQLKNKHINRHTPSFSHQQVLALVTLLGSLDTMKKLTQMLPNPRGRHTVIHQNKAITHLDPSRLCFVIFTPANLVEWYKSPDLPHRIRHTDVCVDTSFNTAVFYLVLSFIWYTRDTNTPSVWLLREVQNDLCMSAFHGNLYV